jgi:hypothetical protein
MEHYFRTRASVDDEPDLAHNRRANDARLKSRFEHIFAKYGKDFEDVGDEIDLDTGEIVVNNGHLESMRHEVDPGKSVSSQVLQVLGGSAHTKNSSNSIPTVGIVNESSTEGSDDEEGLSVAGSSGYSSGNANIDEDDNRRPREATRAPDQRLSGFDEARDDSQFISDQRDMAPLEQKTGVSENEQNINSRSHPTSRGRSQESAPMNLSFLQNSMEAVLAKPGQGESIDPGVIQALGQSIANQLAMFMNNPSKKRKSESSNRRTTNDSRWEYPVLPGDPTARTPSPPPPASSSAALFARSPDDEASIWAAEVPRRHKRQRTSLRTTETIDSAAGDDERDDESLPNVPHAPTPRQNSSRNNETSNGRVCSHCGVTKSRQWRISPEGGYLCNACGTYFFRYGKSRPSGVFRSVNKPDSNQASPASPQVRRPPVESVDVFSIPVTSTPGTNGYAANTARRMTGDARYARLTVEEEDTIIKLRAIDQLDWRSIGESVSNRTESSVQFHYRKLRRRSDFEDRLRLLAQDTSKSPALSERVVNDTQTPNQVAMTPPSPKSTSREITGLQNSPLPSAHAGSIEGPARPSGNEGPGSRPRFSDSEKKLLMRLREGNMEWMQIASYLPGRTLNSLKAMDRRLTLAQESPTSDDVAYDESVSADQPPYTTEDDDLMVLMRDQEGMPFAEMTEYFAGRAEADLVLRYEHLKASRPVFVHGQTTSFDAPSHALGGPCLPRSNLQQEAQREPVPPLEDGEAHDMMPPPTRPDSQRTRIDVAPAPAPVAFVPDSIQSVESVNHSTPAPQTPSFPIPSLSRPPRPLEVGPSAWTATQPTSKGPLPFKPARRSLIPLVPRGPPYTIADPFVSNRNSVGEKQTSRSDNAASETHRQPRRHAKERARANLKDLYEAFPAFDESTSTNSSQSHEGRMTSNVSAPQDSWSKDTRVISVEDNYKATSPAVKAQARTTSTTPDTKRRKPYSEEESRLVKRLKDLGLSYAKIAAQMPGRTPISIQNHYYYTYTSTVANSKAQSSRATAKRTPFSPPLLRQALDNSTRRSSAGTDIELLAIDTARKFLQEVDSTPVGTSTDGSPHRTVSQDFLKDTTTHDDGSQTSREGSVSSDAESNYQSGRSNVHAMFQAFDGKMASEMTGLWGVPTSGLLYNSSSFPVSLQMASAGRESGFEAHLSADGMTASWRKESSPCVYIDNAVRSEGNRYESHVFSLDQSAVHGTSAAPQAVKHGANVTSVGSGDSHNQSHERGTSPPPEYTLVSRDAPNESSVEGMQDLDEELDTGRALDNDEPPGSVAHEVETSQHARPLPQKVTRRKRSPGRSKRASDLEIADSDSDAVQSSQLKPDEHEVVQERAPEARITPAKRGRGRPRRSVPLIATAPEVITISSDPPIKPELASNGNITTTQPLKYSEKSQQPIPRSKTSRHSASALIQRPSNPLATPARRGDGNASFSQRSGTLSMAKRFESLSRTGPRESPVTRDPSGSTRRVIMATAAREDEGNGEFDELS